MSNRLMTLAKSLPLKSGPKAVLLVLADTAGEDGDTWQSAATLAHWCGMGNSTAWRHLAALESMGLVSRRRRRNTSSLLHLDEGAMRDLGQCADQAVVINLPTTQDRPENSRIENSQSENSRIGNSELSIRQVAYKDEPSLNPHSHVRDEQSGRFDEFWSAYPKRGGKSMAKDDARKAWRSILKAIAKPDADGVTWTVDQIIAGAQRYARECESFADRGYVKTPGPWLRAGGWKYDDATPTGRDPEQWLRAEWLEGRVQEIHKLYVVGYARPDPGPGDYWTDVLKPYNREWINTHHDAILARLATSEAS